MKHLPSFIKHLLRMYYVPGTELSSADIDKEESTCSQEVHNLSEIAQKQLYIA